MKLDNTNSKRDYSSVNDHNDDNGDNDFIFPSINDVENARNVLSTYDIGKTPLIKSNTFSKLIGANIYLKNESMQTTGTFKIRGALYKVDKIVKERKINNSIFSSDDFNVDSKKSNTNSDDNRKINGIIAASAGNHAQGVALASQLNKLSCTIVMPTKAPPSKISATKAYGAKVILEGESYEDSLALAQKIAKDQHLYQIHAYDDYDIIAGQGTIGLEILEDLSDVDKVYVPIGGGGLISGIAIAIKMKKPSVKIIGVESEAYSAMRESLKNRSIISTKSGRTIADSISIKSPGELTFRIIEKFIDEVVLVDDYSIVKTMFLLMEREKIVIEPSGAAALAYLLKSSDDLNGEKTVNDVLTKENVVVILSGGNVDMYLLDQIVSKGLMQTGRLFKIFVKLPDRPGAFKDVLDIIVELGINIVEVIHDRLSPRIPPGMAGVSLSLEMQNETFADKLVSLLSENGIEFEV